jgi:hypothetical protein
VTGHDDTPTAAHEQRSTIHILAHVPEHAPREDDPHYHLFMQAKARIKRQGLWKCALNDDLCGGQLELHHSHVEFSQVNAVDPAKLEQAFGLHFENDEAFQQWVEGPGNLEVLCLPGDELVRMADGSLAAIKDVSVGDFVLGHDCQAHAVVSVAVSDFIGDLVVIDGRRMTGNHPVLTERGWVPAASVRSGDLACYVTPADEAGIAGNLGMLDAHVLSMGGIQAQVLGPIVVSNVVDVVDGLKASERASDYAFHDETVFHDEASFARRPVYDSDVARGLDVSQRTFPPPGIRQRVESGQATRVRAELLEPDDKLPGLGEHRDSTVAACRRDVVGTSAPPTFTAALSTACRVPLGEIRRHTVVIAADSTLLNREREAAAFVRRWRAVNHVEHLPFIGQVYDIEVSDSNSFIATDLVVHNCVNHHRTHYGVHVLPSALWEAVRWHRAGQPAPAEFVAAKDVPK